MRAQSTAPVPAATIPLPVEGDYGTLVKSWRRAMLAQNKAPQTIRTYLDQMILFGRFLSERGMPLSVASITGEHVREYILYRSETCKGNTVLAGYRALRVFFAWLVEEGEITGHPMTRIKPPQVPEEATPIPPPGDIAKLLKSCQGKTYADKRDAAIIALLVDTGCRLSEISYLKVEDVDLDQNLVFVMGKGRRPRVVRFGRKTANLLDKYLRERAKRPGVDNPALWLGQRGPLGDDGVYQMIRKRARRAGLTQLWPHMFRHAFAHNWLSQGGQETDLMRLAGWRSRTMLSRYGASAAQERALAAYAKFSPLDNL
jgi:site-specific recombinase XerD